MAYNPDPRLVQAIQASTDDKELQAVLLATALVESGGRLDATGDGGTSFGPYQMHVGGRLTSAGFTPEQAKDPLLSTQAAIKEFLRFRVSDPGLWAANAQRPANASAYAARVRGAVPEAAAILAKQDTGGGGILGGIGGVLGGIGGALDDLPIVGDVIGAGGAVVDTGQAIAGFLGTLVNPDSWKRAGMGIGGAILILVSGVLIYNSAGVSLPVPMLKGK